MTPQQIDLEFAHIALDKQERDGDKETYHDDSYEQYDEDSEDYDNKVSDMPTEIPQIDPHAGLKVRTQEQDDWEDVETDDY